MKQRRGIPWKRLAFGAIAAFLIVQLFREYFTIAVFFSIILGLTALKMALDFYRDRRRVRRLEEDREEAASRRREERRELCRETRYFPEEREAVEAYIQEALGPVFRWDRQEGHGTPDVDVALIPPTETVPYWRAATAGAGAVKAKCGRSELSMLLPSDWDPGEKWPLRVLREAVQTFLIYGDGVRPGASFRGYHLLGAGFAGATAVEYAQGLPGFPEPKPLILPSGDTLWFCRLLPLLKPEWDYVQERGLANLFRRMAGKDPAANPRRKPWADWDWFRVETAPFAWSETEGQFCLGLDTREFQRGLFHRAGLVGTGWDWERLVGEYLRRSQPDDLPFVDFACEEWVFFAASADADIMRKLALGLSDLLRFQPEQALALLVPDERLHR